jgi:hypothetical protein
VKKIFYDNEGRLRSGWRALLFLLAYVFVSGTFIALYAISRGEVETEKAGGLMPLVIPFAIATVVAVVLGWGFGRRFEGVPFDALGMSLSARSVVNFTLGAVLGTVTFVVAVLIAVLTQSMSLAVNHESAASAISYNLLTTLFVFAVGAASEETLFRGYFLQTFVRSKVIVAGMVVTSGLFAYAHNLNPSVNVLALMNTFIAGIWFAAAYLKTRDLWFPFGIHLAWNWLQGPIFGINVSGIGEFSPDPLMRAHDAGPAWLTGGAYGIEGGVACTFALVLSLVVIRYMPLRLAPAAQARTQ